jgi:signal transduction histidine kinase
MKAFLERLSRRLALTEAFGWPTFWLAAFVYFGTTVLFDARRFGGPFELWLLGWAIGQAVLLIWVLVFKYLWLKNLRGIWSRVAAVLLIGTTAGIVRGVFLAIFSTGLGLAETPQLAFRLGGGGIAGFVLTIAGAGLIGAAVEHQRAVSRLVSTSDELLRTRSAAPQLLAKTRDEIAELAGATLLPRLRALDEALEKAKVSTNRVAKMAKEIRALLNQEVRPMSSSLAQKVVKTLSSNPEPPASKLLGLGLPKSFDLSNALSPGPTFGLALMLSLATFLPLTDLPTTALSFAGAGILFVVIKVMVRITRSLKAVPLTLGTLLLGAIGAISTIPLSVLTQWSMPKYLNLSALPIQSAMTMAVLVVGIGFTRIVDSERAVFEGQLAEFNRELERELKWVDAQIWVIRRDWAYLLHGRVQSALTAALARIGYAPSVNAETIDLVHQDVDRARQALLEGIGQPFDLEASLREIAESWDGICELELAFEAKAISSMKSDIGLARSINEILREAISNGVRHGNATHIHIELFEGDGVIELTASNNGSPVTNQSKLSVGTEMMNELTLEWSLQNIDSRVALKAKLPKATSFSS